MKTYSTATYLKVNDKTRANYLCELLSSVLKSAAETVDHVDYDEVRLLPSAGSIYVGLLVQADMAGIKQSFLLGLCCRVVLGVSI